MRADGIIATSRRGRRRPVRLITGITLFLGAVQASTALAQTTAGDTYAQEQLLRSSNNAPARGQATGQQQSQRAQGPGVNRQRSAQPALSAPNGHGVLPALPKAEQARRQQTFEQGLRASSPLTPAQIRMARRYFRQQQRANAEPINPVPPAHLGSEPVNLNTVEQPRTIRLQPDFATTLQFRDAAGNPWPIEAVVRGAPGDIAITQPREGGNTLSVTPKIQYPVTNVFVYLQDLQDPLVYEIRRAEKARDTRIGFRVPRLGPASASEAELQQAPQSASLGTRSETMLAFADGAPPEKAAALSVAHAGLQGWRLDNHVYLRARNGLTLLSPSWSQTMRGPGRARVYKLDALPPIVLVRSDQGQILEIEINA